MRRKVSAAKRADYEKRLHIRYGNHSAKFWRFCERVWKVIEHSNTSSLVFVVDGLVLTGSDQDLKEFKDSRTSICITCGVAGAVFTQVALTALSLPAVQSAHWVARGLWVASIFYGFFAVKGAVEQQVELSSWLDARQLRDELSFRSKIGADEDEWCNGVALDCVLGLISPYRCLSFSSLAFFLGLAVYLGTLWTSGGNQDQRPNDSRNIFLCLICCLGIEVIWSFTIGYITGDGFGAELDDEADAALPESRDVTVNTMKGAVDVKNA